MISGAARPVKLPGNKTVVKDIWGSLFRKKTTYNLPKVAHYIFPQVQSYRVGSTVPWPLGGGVTITSEVPVAACGKPASKSCFPPSRVVTCYVPISYGKCVWHQSCL